MKINAAAGEALKRHGQQLALDYSGPWQDRVLGEFRAWLAAERARGMTTITIERFRADATTSQPLIPKAWGVLPRLAIKAGLISRQLNGDGSPVYRKAAAPKTRAHPVGVYRILGQ